MSEVTDIVVPILQQIQARLGRMETSMDALKDDMRNVKVRVTSIEENSGALNRRLDSFDFRLERIERRLELVGAP